MEIVINLSSYKYSINSSLFKIVCTLALYLLLLSLLMGCEKSGKLKEDPGGFRNILWETDIKNLSDMEFLKDEDNAKVYIRKNDKLAIGDIRLDAIYYKFYKGKFYEVEIKTRGFMNFLNLKDLCFEKYGKAKKEKDSLSQKEKYYWSGDKTSISLGYYGRPDEVILTFDSWRLSLDRLVDLFNEEEKRKKEALKDF